MANVDRSPVLLDHVTGAASSSMARFIDWLRAERGVKADDYEALWSWSVEHPDDFWASLWDFFSVQASAPYGAVLADASMPGARWFPGARLNYAEQVFAQASSDRPALVAV